MRVASLVLTVLVLAASAAAEQASSLSTEEHDQCLAPVVQGPAPGVEPCVAPSNDMALLQGGRFRVAVCWQTPQGTSGTAKLFLVTRESGLFWFFNPGNVELIVKVLDACIEPFDHWWVFAGGVTNVEVTITVTDSFTDESKTYQNPIGAPFQPILDTGAFETCS